MGGALAGVTNKTTRRDRLLCTTEWELLFPSCFLQSLPSLMSDHTPLLLLGVLQQNKNLSFRFENFCTRMDGFQELVQDIWSRQVTSTQPLKRLHIKLTRVVKGIKRWRKEKIGDTRQDCNLLSSKKSCSNLRLHKNLETSLQMSWNCDDDLKPEAWAWRPLKKLGSGKNLDSPIFAAGMPTQNSFTFAQAQEPRRIIFNACTTIMGLLTPMKIKKS